jgi:hypothetical protein
MEVFMKHARNNPGAVLFILFILFSGILFAAPLKGFVQDDTVKVFTLAVPPAINGTGDDACWQNISWQSIDQVWIPYGGTVDPDDYSGRYKIAWSSQENLLYFLVEITDDAAVGGYDPQGGTSDIYHFDIIEVFIDEDKSGGFHGYGEESENAFGYHMYSDFPDNGKSSTNLYVGDTPSEYWEDHFYADHFPEYVIRKEGTVYTREFSLIIYNDTYDGDNPAASRVQLQEGKIMGLSLAYCDNDGIDEPVYDKSRDNFFGSVWVSEEHYNDHWQLADDFGTIQLVSVPTLIKYENRNQESDFQIFPNPAKKQFKLKLNNNYTGPVNITIYNILGQKIYDAVRTKTYKQIEETIFPSHLYTGVYFLDINFQGEHLLKKLLIVE